MSKQLKNKLFLFAGHFAIDTIIKYQKEYEPALGGSVSYCSLALRTYAPDVEISIISNIGKLNFNNNLLDTIRTKDIDLEGIIWSDLNNTHFILEYLNHMRVLTLKSRSPDLKFEDIPEKFLKNHPDAIILVPICNEISYEYILKITKNFPNTYIGIDLQGFIRKIDDEGKVSLIQEEKIINNMNKIINLIGDKLILKGSEEEMKILSGKEDLFEVMEYFHDIKYRGISIMTLAERGSMITRYDKQLLVIPAFKPEIVVDETGAGDVYLAIFLYEFINSDKSWESIKNAGYLASAAASFLIEKKGPEGCQSKKKVIERVKKKKYLSIRGDK
ncbi:MAG: PfkB family carbohydrate kinase [Promethearchaeota archaeon]